MAGLSACSVVNSTIHGVGDAVHSVVPDQASLTTRYLGSVAADDPQAVDIGRSILQDGGRAADAAAAMGFGLTVTLPSRAGLDGGGVCLVHDAATAKVEEIDFVPPALPETGPQVPGLARGLATLQARYGVLRWQEAVGRAEQLAERGLAVTPILLADLKAAGLATDGPGGSSLAVGDVLPQRAVASTLSDLRTAGARDFYTGELAARLVAAGVPADVLAKWSPQWKTPLGGSGGPGGLFSSGGTQAAFADLPGGQATAAAWRALASGHPADSNAAFGVTQGVAPAGDGHATATTAFAVTDASGNAVTCAIGMGRLFGTGHVIEGLDIYAAAPFDAAGADSLVTAIVSGGGNVTAAVAGAGSAAAPASAAAALWLATEAKQSVSDALSGKPGIDRINAVVCPEGLPGHSDTCVATRDPRGAGYAMTVDRIVK